MSKESEDYGTFLCLVLGLVPLFQSALLLGPLVGVATHDGLLAATAMSGLVCKLTYNTLSHKW